MIVNAPDKDSQIVEDAQPTFLAAIAWELANVHGGTVQQHAGAARQMLASAFRSLERNERAVRQSRVVHAA